MQAEFPSRAAWSRAPAQRRGRDGALSNQDCGIKPSHGWRWFKTLAAGPGGFEIATSAMVVGDGADRKPWQIQIRVAVVGSGYFGRFHADHYARNPRAELVAVVDTDEARARAVATEFGAEAAVRLSAASSAGSMRRASPCRRRSITTSRAS